MPRMTTKISAGRELDFLISIPLFHAGVGCKKSRPPPHPDRSCAPRAALPTPCRRVGKDITPQIGGLCRTLRCEREFGIGPNRRRCPPSLVLIDILPNSLACNC